MLKPCVSIIIPVCNQWPLTVQCLTSLAEHTPLDAVEIIVVDNGSEDNTARDLHALCSHLFDDRFLTIRFEENIHSGPGCNASAKAAQAPLLFFLNNDTLLTPDWFDPLLIALEQNPGLMAVSPLLVYRDKNRVQSLGVAIAPDHNPERLYSHFPATHPVTRQPRDVQALSTKTLLLTRNSFLQAGGFPESNGNDFNKLELSCRLKQMGGRLQCVPKSQVVHLESFSTGIFGNIGQNTPLLSSNCQDCFTPDLHYHAREDGYHLAITPWLEPYMALPADREKMLDDTRPNDLDTLRQTLLEEPLWAKGYQMSTKMLTDQGNFNEACSLTVVETALLPSAAGFTRLIDASIKAHEPELAQKATKQLKYILGRLADRQSLLEHAQEMVFQARKLDDPELEQLYSSYLE